MILNVIRKSSPFAQFIFAMFLLLMTFTVLMLVSEIIANFVFDVSFFNIDMNLIQANSKELQILKVGQLIQSLSLFVIPPIIIGIIFESSAKKYLSFQIPNNIHSLWKRALIIIASIPLINFLSDFNLLLKLPQALSGMEQWMQEKEELINSVYKLFIDTNATGAIAFNILIMVLVPAIGEELLFRGVFQRLLTNLFKNIHVGIFITAIIFSAMHMQFYSFLPRFFFGIIFGYALVWTGSIWVPILMHFINNLMAVIYEHLLIQGSVSDKMETIGKFNDMIWMVIPSIALVLFLMLELKKKKIEASS